LNFVFVNYILFGLRITAFIRRFKDFDIFVFGIGAFYNIKETLHLAALFARAALAPRTPISKFGERGELL
jgi:hypothetical protein